MRFLSSPLKHGMVQRPSVLFQKRKLHLIPWFAGRKARLAYAKMDAPEKEKFWQKKGKIALYMAAGTGAVVGAVVWTHIEPAPVTNRKRVLLFDLENEIMLGKNSAQAILDEQQGKLLPPTHPSYQRIHQVFQRLVKSLPKTPVDQMVSAALDFDNLYVIDSPDTANAFVLPDGSTFVFSGLLDKECSGADGEGKLAVVLGHEMAHALQRHGGERLSYGGIISPLLMGVTFVCTFLGLDLSGGWWSTLCLLNMEQKAFEVLTMLPQNRQCESEADHVGILITAAACYDPVLGPKLWRDWNTRVVQPSNDGDGDGVVITLTPPEYLSTHPANERREKDLNALLPEAEKMRNEACMELGNSLKDAAKA
mmetsp:Transcript_15454/g.31762  ORF Transcript_15454/g.31762 Transcript_15454/m.31762 type:complete len:366 (-) Transcript_15454:104-1201(-)